MTRYIFSLLAVATMAGLAALVAPAPGHADGASAPYVTEIPQGYRDWRWISSAHEAGKLNSLGALLGNDVAVKAFRDGTLPFPDGTMLAALHYRYVPSAEKTTKSLARHPILRSRSSTHQRSVHGQGLKSTIHATGGWGFGHFAPDAANLATQRS